MNTGLMPKTYSAREIQRNYRAIFDEAQTMSPIVILNNNKPDVAIVNINFLESLLEKVRKVELEDAFDSLAVYKKEKKEGKLKKLRSPNDLLTL